ncbi:MAG TPA: thermonuclease family protein [Pyrinomonadaceae bacterium]|nr:thermonuclease family protein [Pyrinomonadaceae bacterium]
MKRQFLLTTFLLLFGTYFTFAQMPTTDLNRIRSETSQRNKAIEDYDRRNSQNRSIIISRNGSLAATGKIPGPEIRSYVLAAQADTEVKVLAVESGDILQVTDGTKTVTVRIIGIDAPEAGQTFFEEAKKNLSDLIENKKVVLVYSLHNLKDQLGYFPARVFVDGKDVGLNALENGYAWRNEKDKFFVEKKYDAANEQAQIKAQNAKIGIWQNEKPQKPWEYREKLEKEKQKTSKK